MTEDPKKVADDAADRVISEITAWPALNHGWMELEDQVQAQIRSAIAHIFLGTLLNSIMVPSEGLGK